MRLTTSMWVSALLHRVFAAGEFGAVGKRGANEAGAVFIVRRGRDGVIDLYGPALQLDYDSDDNERRFSLVLENCSEEALSDKLNREKRLDSEFWVVDIEVTGEKLSELIAVTKLP